MSEMTREQFASSVAAAISSVDHLYREVDRLIAGLREGLREAPHPLAPVRGNLGKSARNPARFVVRYEYGLLLGPVAANDDVDDDDEDLEEEAEDDVSEKPRKGGHPEILAGQPLLAIRIAVYDPNKPESFEPELQYALMSDWAVGSNTPATPGQRLVLQPHIFRRITKALETVRDAKRGSRCLTRAPVKRVIGGEKSQLGPKKGDARRLSCSLPAGVETLPLFALDGAEQLSRLTASMKAMWSDVVNQ